jgi:hypothetical protein
MDLLKTRLQAMHSAAQTPGSSSSSNVQKALQQLRQDARAQPGLQRITALWRGVGAALAKDVPFAAIYWSLMEPLRTNLAHLANHDFTAAATSSWRSTSEQAAAKAKEYGEQYLWQYPLLSLASLGSNMDTEAEQLHAYSHVAEDAALHSDTANSAQDLTNVGQQPAQSTPQQSMHSTAEQQPDNANCQTSRQHDSQDAWLHSPDASHSGQDLTSVDEHSARASSHQQVMSANCQASQDDHSQHATVDMHCQHGRGSGLAADAETHGHAQTQHAQEGLQPEAQHTLHAERVHVTQQELMLQAQRAQQIQDSQLQHTSMQREFWSALAVNGAAGVLAGASAAAITTPFDVVKTRVQTSDASKPAASMWHATAQLLREGGAKALYRGVGPRTVRTAAAYGILMSSYELCKVACASSPESLWSLWSLPSPQVDGVET